MGEEKKRLRATALAKRDSLTAQQRQRYSGTIIKKLAELPCYREADAILTYISFRSEVDTFPLLEQAFADGKAVFAPKVTGKEMAFYRIFSRDDLSAGYQGILEPAGGLSFEGWVDDQISQYHGSQQESMTETKETEKCLICMPGAAFDRARHRIGYGGGFFDRYLSRLLQESENMDGAVHPQAGGDEASRLRMKVTTAALAYDCQIFEEIPWEAHDVCPMYVVTEQEILR